MSLGLLYIVIALVILIIYVTEWNFAPNETYAPNNRDLQENSQSYWSSRIDDAHSTNFKQTNSQIYFD